MRKIFHFTLLLLPIVNAFGNSDGDRISGRKCDEYRKMIPRSKGALSDAMEYSFMVKVFIGNDDCRNGELISEHFVLSVGEWSNETARIELGFLSADKNQTQVIAVSEQIRSPDFNSGLWLLKMIQPVKFNEFIRPVCFDRGTVSIAGRGIYSEISIKNGLRRRQNTITLVSISEEQRLLICDECEGEKSEKSYDWQFYTEGDALLNEQNELTGIKMEGSPTKCFGMFYQVSYRHYLDWIEQNVWPDSHTTPTPTPTSPSNTGMEIGTLSFTVLLVIALTSHLF